MTLYDTYGGPEAWGRYCELQDELTERAKWGQECGACASCRQPDPWGEFEDYPPIGWCEEGEFFVDPRNNPGDYDCDEWTCA